MNADSALLQAALSVVAAHLSNPNTRVETSDVPNVMRDFYQAAVNLPGSVQPQASVPAIASQAQASLPAPPAPAEEAAVALTEEARASLAGSAAFVGGDLPEAGAHLQARIWQGVPRKTQDKFRQIIETWNIPIGIDGYPVPRRPLDKLISDSGMHVADPITGQYHTMLKRHLKVAHGLEHEELLAMFGLTENQLPRSGPAYSAAKAEQARRTGLGRTKAPDVVEAPAATEAPKRRRRERAAA